jgi:alkylation response protein AidB-like acyl-CoA dehydrogenase
MNLDDSPDQAAFRRRLREWLAEHAPAPLENADLDADHDTRVAWHQELFRAGFTALSWPPEYGGQGLGPVEEAIFAEETGRLGVPSDLGYGFIARAMLLFASEEHRRRYLPPLLAGTELWCQGFSEPDAGSDLASLRTRAVLDDDGTVFRVNGQKTWTSNAQWADFCLCLVRTGTPEDRHRGISTLMIDMTAPGIDVRPIKTIRGDEEFCEVFFDDVEVPAENLIGELGQGWNYAMVTLTYERGPVDVGFVSKYFGLVDRLWQELAERRDTDPALRRAVARVAAGVEVLRLHTLRSLSARVERPPGPEGSIDKLLGAKVEQDLLHAALKVVGGACLVDTRDDWFSHYLYSRAATIYGGTAQIQRNVLADHCLKLPRA